MSTSDSSTSLRATLAHFASQAHDALRQHFYEVADAQATYDLGKSTKDLSPEEIQQVNARRRKWVKKQLNILQSTPQGEAARPLKFNPGFAVALPIRDAELKPGPLFTSEQPPTVPDSQLAAFFYCQWERHYELARAKRLDLLCHPDSVIYNETGVLTDHSEWGVQTLHLTELLARMYRSADPAIREAATTFRRAPGLIRWYQQKPSELSSFYQPEATYVLRGRQIAVCIPEGFYFSQEPVIGPFLQGFRRLFEHKGMPYKFWCPGLCQCPESASELEAFLSRFTSG